MSVLDLHFCMGFSPAVRRGSSLAVVQGLLTAVASLVPEHRLEGAQASVLSAWAH